MNNTSKEIYSLEGAVGEKHESDKNSDDLISESVKNANDSTLLTVSPAKCITECESSSPDKRESITSVESGKNDDSDALISDCSIMANEESGADPKRSPNQTDSIDSNSDKNYFSSSDIILIEDDKSAEISKNSDILDKKSLEISMNSDIHIVETPEKITDSKSFNDSVQIVTPDANTTSSDNDLTKLMSNIDSLKKIVSEDSEKFISPINLDSKNTSERINFESQPTYSTPNEVKTSNIDVGGSSTESLIGLPPIYKKIGFYVELSASIHMNKDVWTGEMTNMTFDVISNESVPLRLSDGSGNLADVSKSVSPSSSTSLIQLPLKPNRISLASSSSSSSGLSSASTLARKLFDNSKFLNRNKKDDFNLSDEYVTTLYEKWINSNQMCNKFLAFIDKNILKAESITNDDSLKDKPVEEAVKPPKEVKEPLPRIEEVRTPVSTNKTRQARGKRQAKVKFTTDSESEIPKKRHRRAESTEILVSTKYGAGDSVFAKWGDRKFYAATLGQMSTEGKWQVNFFDGDKKLLLEEFLIKAEDYTMIGSSVYASQGDDNFTPGIITGFDVKDGVLQYIVVRDKGDISVPCQFIYITESQARQIRAKTTTVRVPTKLNENLMLSPTNKRSTRSKTKQLVDSPKPSVSGIQKNINYDSDDDEKDNNSEINLEEVAGVEPESQGVYENGIKLKGKTLTGKMRFARTSKSNDTDSTVLGPVPDEGSKYFKNFHVLLTCTRPQSPKLQVRDNSNVGSSSSESENYVFSTIPFVKDRLKLQLQMGGASVYNNFDDISQKFWKNTYLISNRPNNSAKYIQCLAAGIKVLCHEWVIRCCIEKKKMPLQELPLGWSLELERYFNWYDRKSSNALKKTNLLIADTGDKNFLKFWTKICKLADINVTKLMRDSNLEQITAIISESGYRDEHIERALSYNIPIVATTWLIQSLLHGEPRQFGAHKSYLTEYVESD